MSSEAEKSSVGSESGRGERLRMDEACDSTLCGTPLGSGSDRIEVSRNAEAESEPGEA
jgi:hypothetical protein